MVETSFGAAYSSNAVDFRLRKTNSSGTSSTVTTWTHPANTYFYAHGIAGTSLNNVHNHYVWIEVVGDGGADASGYSVTLTWKKS